MIDLSRRIRIVLAGAVAAMMLMGLAACAWNRGTIRERGTAAQGGNAVHETGDVFPGKETYAANLIARSDNTLSSQEKEKVLKEISDELDYIMNVVQSLEIADDEALGQPEEETKGG
jgi:hypothetical protein